MKIKEEEVLAYTIVMFITGASLTALFIMARFWFWLFLIGYVIAGIYYFSKRNSTNVIE